MLDWSLAEPLVERAVRRAPVLADAQLMRTWTGLYEMTPDQTGIVSAVPGVAGLHVIAGFSGHGFMHGPIAGQLMAELITDGRASTVDIAPLGLDRFARGETSSGAPDVHLIGQLQRAPARSSSLTMAS